MEEVGGDGFVISAIHSPGAIEESVDLVVPELQRRGRFRAELQGSNATGDSQAGGLRDEMPTLRPGNCDLPVI